MKAVAFLVLLGVAVAAATTCPDGSSCSATSTCCPTATGGYGCCPTVDATCCSDHEHCCPKEYPVCDVSQGLCKKASTDAFGILMLTKEESVTPAVTAAPAPEVAETTCPDGSSCSATSTCCPTATGGYGCCPTVDATCCSDHEHCCPKEYPVCDVSQGLCKKASTDAFGISMLVKEESVTPAPETTCPDGSSCSATSTCCPTATGGYGCCPTVDATCCSDHEHCCPKEYPVCDVSQGLCKKSALDGFGISMLTKDTPVVTKPAVYRADIIDLVNKADTTWKAGVNEFFLGWEKDELESFMGAIPDDLSKLPEQPEITVETTPASFDARTKWPSCVGPILNQARCGSCWAFGAAESISDRMCITGKVSSYLQLAPLDLVECDGFCSGCQGGAPSMAWMFAQYNGLVTESCLPYLVSEGGPIPTCPPEQQPCLNFVQTPSCQNQCSASGQTYTKHHISSYYGVPGEQAMIKELITNGPFEVTMTVYADFPHYKSGVYQHLTGAALGGHAIKVIGYGTESGKDYWMIQNSWTTTWGDGGYFKILRGVNECGIESGGVAGDM